jgi:hypothetical protein
MKIFGDISKIEVRQMVGIYAERYKKWYFGRVTEISENGIHVTTSEGSRFTFNHRGECIAPNSGHGIYFLAHCGPIPSRYRYTDDDREARNYIADSYTEHVVNSN